MVGNCIDDGSSHDSKGAIIPSLLCSDNISSVMPIREFNGATTKLMGLEHPVVTCADPT